ncbi:MAG TPA: prepilin-type N-terminal cleavage/methylation domain-containing protein [Stellaceae bacterium]|nr:prepilin-type N-terminal cleavage/methylation domain-containing protein [Stellaceae bacterium]
MRTEGDPRAPRRHLPGGFTLLEVIVALAIAGLAFVLLFRAGGTGLVAANTASRTEEAVERAQSHLAAIGREASVVAGDRQGNDGGGFRWQLSVRPLASRPILSPNGVSRLVLTLYEVTVAISWKTQNRDRRVVLETRRVATAQMPQ